MIFVHLNQQLALNFKRSIISVNRFFKMSMSEACCTLPPVTSNYKPVGTKLTIGDIEVYKVGEPSSKAALIGCYDIFGFHDNTFQVCDILAQHGYFVVLPDFFRAKPWSLDNFPPKDFSELADWAFVKHSWTKVHKDINTVLDALEGDIKSKKKKEFSASVGEEKWFLKL